MTRICGRFRAAVLMGAAVSVLAFAAKAKAQNRSDNHWPESKGWSSDNWVPNDNPWPYNKLQGAPVLAVVGDVACQPGDEEAGEKAGENCSGDTAQNLNASQAATAQQIENMKPDLVALVGDEQYQVGQYSDFENSYELSYGAFKSITRPSPGNHEFYVEHGAIGVAGYGYFSYFNGVRHNTDGSVMMATIAGNPDTGGTFTQPVPYSDGQAGHFEQTGGLGTNTAGGSVGVGDGWYSYNLGPTATKATVPATVPKTGNDRIRRLCHLRPDLASASFPSLREIAKGDLLLLGFGGTGSGPDLHPDW